MLHSKYTLTIIFMATSKHRINLSVTAELDDALIKLAARDEMSVSSKVIHLLRHALEIEEDAVLQAVAEQRDQKGTKFLSHEAAWR